MFLLLLLCAIVLVGMQYTLERFEIQEFIYIPPQMDIDAEWGYGGSKKKRSKRKKKASMMLGHGFWAG